jgi:hypothetical protein
MRTRKLIKKFYINLHDPDVHVHRYLDMFKHNVAIITLSIILVLCTIEI